MAASLRVARQPRADFSPNGAPSAPKRRYALFMGQSLFMPKNVQQQRPDPRDRPYAGWAYLGASLQQEGGGCTQENFEIDLGVVGPLALGDPVQQTWHRIIGDAAAKGRGYQLHDEPGSDDQL
jgi:lipid A 3-O-deacylase